MTCLAILANQKEDKYDSIVVIVNQLTKMVYYKLMKIIIDAPRLANIIMNVIVFDHRFQNLIVTNRGFVTVLLLFFPFSSILSLLLNLMLLYYKTRIRLARVTWPHPIFLSFYVTRGKHRCRLPHWPTEPALLVSRVYTGRTLFKSIQG